MNRRFRKTLERVDAAKPLLAALNFWLSLLIAGLFIWAGSSDFSKVFPPGDPATGLWGAGCLSGSFLYSLLRRTAYFTPKIFASDFHLSLGIAGVSLILIHSGGSLHTPTGLVNSILAIIFLLGANLRFISSRQAFRSFSSRSDRFVNFGSGRGDLENLIRGKKNLLPRLDPSGEEATFGLHPGIWARHPLLAARYFILSRMERRAVIEACGAPPSYLNFSQGWGRYLHILLGAAAAIGIFLHLGQNCPYFGF